MLQGIGHCTHIPGLLYVKSLGNGSSYNGICAVPSGTQGRIWTMLHTEIMMGRQCYYFILKFSCKIILCLVTLSCYSVHKLFVRRVLTCKKDTGYKIFFKSNLKLLLTVVKMFGKTLQIQELKNCGVLKFLFVSYGMLPLDRSEVEKDVLFFEINLFPQ